MDNGFIANQLKEKFGDGILDISEPYGLLTAIVNKNLILDVASWLSEKDGLQFGFLTDITAVHYPEQKGEEFCVVYHLHNLQKNIRIRLKAFVSAEKPELFSMTSIFKSANWMERETFDFYGIRFIGHPNLKRILNMDEMDYFPMQKQYPLEDQQREDKEDKFFGR
jgi:NADH-quinone oxidoreductase subunit C